MTTDLSRIPVLVPDDVEDPADLPMGMLDSACNHLKCDVIEAVRGEVPGKRYAAMVELCYQWARLAGEKADRETYRKYKIEEIGHALGWDREAKEPPDPTRSSGDSEDVSSESP